MCKHARFCKYENFMKKVSFKYDTYKNMRKSKKLINFLFMHIMT